MENSSVGRITLPITEKDTQQQISLDPLAENFDFDSWAKRVKKQMKTSLKYPFSSYLSK
ncbi:MAG: hypothetical protein WBM32_20750 [Crocosphaera sp.]